MKAVYEQKLNEFQAKIHKTVPNSNKEMRLLKELQSWKCAAKSSGFYPEQDSSGVWVCREKKATWRV